MSAIDWRMSAVLENVSRGDSELPEVASLEGAVREWRTLDAELQAEAVLTPERPIAIDGGEPAMAFAGMAIGALAERLP